MGEVSRRSSGHRDKPQSFHAHLDPEETLKPKSCFQSRGWTLSQGHSNAAGPSPRTPPAGPQDQWHVSYSGARIRPSSPHPLIFQNIPSLQLCPGLCSGATPETFRLRLMTDTGNRRNQEHTGFICREPRLCTASIQQVHTGVYTDHLDVHTGIRVTST